MMLHLRLFNVLHVCLDISRMELEDVLSDLYLISYCFNLFISHFFSTEFNILADCLLKQVLCL